MELIRFPRWPLRYTGRIAQIHRDEGLLRLSSRVLHKFAAPAVDWGEVVFFERVLDSDSPAPGHTDFTLREVTPWEGDVLEAGLDPSQPRDEASRRFGRGDRAFAAFEANGTCVHTRWVTTAPTVIPEVGRAIIPGPGQAYFYNGYTRPESRSQGIDGLVRSLIFSTLRSEGFTAVYSYVRSDNPAGLRAASRWQRRVGHVRYIRIVRGRSFVSGARQSTFPPLSKRSTGYAGLPEAETYPNQA
jgi:ribosomal protein S18 acetylase RimI-like enzyme